MAEIDLGEIERGVKEIGNNISHRRNFNQRIHSTVNEEEAKWLFSRIRALLDMIVEERATAIAYKRNAIGYNLCLYHKVEEVDRKQARAELFGQGASRAVGG